MAKLNFDATQIEPQQAFDALPAGWYSAVIEETESKVAKSGNGEYLNITYRIQEGPHANRMVFQRLNLWNTNQTAAEIAHRELSGICHAVGILQIGDSTELHGKALGIKLTVRKQEGWEDSNEVRGYRPIQGASPKVAPPPSKQVAAAPPWQTQ